MQEQSLESIMAAMVSRLAATGQEGGVPASDPLSALDALIPADPVLAALHKEYLEAASRLRKLRRENGMNDPMAEVAADMLDSARSAVQTRLIELQNEREGEMRSMLESRLRARRAQEEAAHVRTLAERRRKNRQDDTAFWLAVCYWLMNRTLFAAQRRLSAANDFAMVSAVQDNRAVYV